MLIDWSKMKTASQIAEENKIKITISRTQGLLWIFRNKQVKDSDIRIMISGMEDESVKYEAEQYFEAATWDSDNVYVQMIADNIGLDTPDKIKQAFLEALEI